METRKRVMSKRSWILVVVLSILILGFIGVRAVLSGFEENLDRLTQLEIADVDLASARDGEYTARCEAAPVAAEVRVTIEGHAIKDIRLLKHDTGKGQAAEVLPARVVAAQSLDVDCVSGATYSSKAILKAIADALAQSVA